MIIYADPPWRQMKGGLRKCRANQKKDLDYSTLSMEEIKGIINNFEGEVLFLWAIDKYLFEAEKIGKDLGYNLHARIIWNKLNGVAPAITIRYSHEYLLLMYKSPMLKIDKDMRGKYTTVLTEKSTKHSKKPEAAYKMIEDLYPCQEKIELFARYKRECWSSWGDEIS